MSDLPLPKPTDAELEILQALWQHGPVTVRVVNEQLNQKREVGYTTTLKWMQLMLEKGLVIRDDAQWPHVYRAAVKEEETQGHLLARLTESAFGGSALKLVLRALGLGQNTREELDQIKALLNDIEPSTPTSADDERA
ncbi:BlaI/MecI/CopY family transcriptional regulator [Hymenobacter sediminis]|uniref:BlaI/MecI/CopY family transcriptional regulator n=1 Tax=Hymenobacter sediminis TaxID=2218621 RepID=UPI000DA66E4E|nr:BlaI/MecI/CopY family transcriptional regulator [Hymenobacter sediminis]RPD43979.1 BlaI/MecI/CopY family transcriptional regulator [Hymenobacter sediminis]